MFSTSLSLSLLLPLYAHLPLASFWALPLQPSLLCIYCKYCCCWVLRRRCWSLFVLVLFPARRAQFTGGWAPAPWVRLLLLLLSFVFVVVRVLLACCLLSVPLLLVLLSVWCSLSWSCLSLRLLAIMLVVVVVVVANANLNSN